MYLCICIRNLVRIEISNSSHKLIRCKLMVNARLIIVKVIIFGNSAVHNTVRERGNFLNETYGTMKRITPIDPRQPALTFV